MDYKKIIEEYKTIKALTNDCKKIQKKASKELDRKIKESLQDKSFSEYSTYFSELFDMWSAIDETKTNFIITPFDEQALDDKYKKYTSISSTPMQQKIKKTQECSTIQADIDYQNKEIIEYLLNKLWSKMFSENMIFLNSKNSNYNPSEKYLNKHWPLYELINQISKIIHEIIKDGSSQKIKISSIKQNEKYEILENNEEVCKYILDTYILGITSVKNKSNNWFPKLKTNKDIQLSHILASSDLIGYIFEYKLMDAKKKKKYFQNIDIHIRNIYTNLTKNNFLYNSIESYIEKNHTEDIVVKYKNHLLSPRTIFIFIISIIQEVVKRGLTMSRNNIFEASNKGYRARGLTEKEIMSRINTDVKSYKLIYYYFDKPASVTIKRKEKKLNAWVTELNKLRYGVFDDYLFTLAQASQITFQESTVTSIKH